MDNPEMLPAEIAAAWGGKDLLMKLLGPTAEYLGSLLRTLVERQTKNLCRVLEAARRTLGNRLDEPGVVNVRVLKEVLEEGGFCEDPLMAEYFGGVLAASRSADGLDDRGMPLLRLIEQLSSHQLRMHYLLYMTFRHLFRNRHLNVQVGSHCAKASVFVPASTLARAMGQPMRPEFALIVLHCIHGLIRSGLLQSTHFWGRKGQSEVAQVTRCYRDDEEQALVVAPTAFGVELFLWAHGYPDVTPAEFFLPLLRFHAGVKVVQLEDATAVYT